MINIFHHKNKCRKNKQREPPTDVSFEEFCCRRHQRNEIMSGGKYEVKGVIFSLKMIFFLKLLVFSWRIIALQHCFGFCHTSTWISSRHTSLLPLEPPSHLPLTPSYPSRLSQSTRFELPASHSKFPLVSVLNMVMYMFQCYSLYSSHPLHPPGGSEGKACSAGDPGSFLVWEGPLEKEMAPHSSTLAWKIPWTEEPGRLQSTGTRLSNFTFFSPSPTLSTSLYVCVSIAAMQIGSSISSF